MERFQRVVGIYNCRQLLDDGGMPRAGDDEIQLVVREARVDAIADASQIRRRSSRLHDRRNRGASRSADHRGVACRASRVGRFGE